MSIYVIDTETTGVTPKDQIIELASIHIKDNFPVKVSSFQEIVFFGQQQGKIERFLPTVPIHPIAAKTHGISYKDLLTCKRKSKEAKLPENTNIIIGHNISFDHRMLNYPEVKTICTLALARKFDKQFGLGFGSHKLDNLVFFFHKEEAKNLITDKHNALMDCVKVLLLLNQLLPLIPNVKSWEELYNFQTILNN